MHKLEQKDPLYNNDLNIFHEKIKTLNTPALIYNFDVMEDTVNKILEDMKLLKNAQLNLALKSVHTIEILKQYSSWGLGCDVASIGELELAKTSGFKEISTTNPAYSIKDMSVMRDNNIIIDLDSISQIDTYGGVFPDTEIGLRLRIPLPAELESDSTFGVDSRFGIDITDERLINYLEKYNLKVVRLHVHTGQMTPQSFIYKSEYLLTVAEFFKDVSIINFGGGMFHFYVDRNQACESLVKVNLLAEEWRKVNNREIEFRFEPGGLLLSGCGYLLSSVMSYEYHKFYDAHIATLDSSAWNIAPWHKPEVVLFNSKDNNLKKTLLAGNTLYEGDFFSKESNGERKTFDLPKLLVGEKILMNASGAYTITNARNFNKIPIPKEYFYKKGEFLLLN